MVIAIEGMDGVGKTTIAKHVANKFNFDFIEKPVKYLFDSNKNPEYFNEILNSVYSLKDPITKTWFFALGNIMGIRKNYTKNIVLDRHFVSNYFWNSDESIECKEIFDTLFKIIGKPDITIVLNANEKNRRERILKRNFNDPDLLDAVLEDKEFMKMIKFLEDNEFNYKVIKTDDLTVKEVEKEVDDVIKKYINLKREMKI